MDKQLSIKLPSSLTAETSVKIWEQVLGAESSGQTIFDASDLTFCDESGLTLLYELRSKPNGFKLINVSPSIEALYGTMLKNFSPKPVEKKSLDIVSSLGKWLHDTASSTKQSITFLGSACCALTEVLLHPSQIRFGEILSVSDEAGSRAVGIICLIGFLMGVIIAFETALVAQIFNGIGIAMTRELGPLMTAILFAGRSGSAFAAQLGTQKVNEELNALTTFGLSPMYFLVVPRLIASSLVVPLLSVFATILGILGGGLVMAMYDITYTQFYVQLLKSVTVTDIVFGLVKAVIFGFVIALIGCQCGMNTGAGAAAVGSSTTKSVVKSIIWIVVIDGAAALLTNRLGI